MSEGSGATKGGNRTPPYETFEAVDWSQKTTLFEKRLKVFPKRVKGHYRTIKWWFLGTLLAIYYLLPWIRWDRGPYAPDQAVLVDIPGRRFYFFFIEIWPQEVYYFTGLLLLGAIGLFLATALFGRVWCAWACPQTVWTDLYMLVERWIEGDRNARMKLDKARWTFGKIRKRAAKHAIWLIIAMLTGGAWVFYFMDAPTLMGQLLTFEASSAAYITIAFLTGSTYLLAGHAREQVCTYMCPYARFQSVMFDAESVFTTYRTDRGEPRGSHKKGEGWEGRGHCIDCTQCISVCPTGIDIREGPQVACINCGLCADACDNVMEQVGLPKGLIAFDSLANVERRKRGMPGEWRLIRPRTIIYAALLAVVGAIMLVSLLNRSVLDISVLQDRNPLYVQLANGDIRNGYTFKIINKLREFRTYRLSVEGLEGETVSIVGHEAGDPVFEVSPDQLAGFKLYVSVPAAQFTSAALPFTFVLTDTESGEVVRKRVRLRGPDQ